MSVRKQVVLYCDNCGSEYYKAESEYKRNLSRGVRSFCSRSCSGKANFKNFGNKRNTSTEHLNPYNQVDEYTNYRFYLRKAKQRKHECSITLKYLKDIFEEQRGKCVYSGVDLVHNSHKLKNNQAYTASLDRIDSSKGYIKDNVQFISIAMNHMKSTMSHEEVLSIIENIKKLK